jgi:hypothetical protein
MKEYYQKLLSETKNQKAKKYYLKMLKELDIPKKERKKQKWIKVYVGSLDKVFRSTRQASFALGKHKMYVNRVLNNKLPNVHNIKYFTE